MPYISEHFLEWKTRVSGKSDDYWVQWGANKFTDGNKKYRKHEWSCDCPDFTFRRRKVSEYCRHIQLVVASDPRCLWVGTDTIAPLFSGLTAPMLEQAKGAVKGNNLANSRSQLSALLEALVAYVPFQHNGDLVRAIFVTDQEWEKHIRPEAYVDLNNLRVQGGLSVQEFNLLCDFIRSRSESDLDRCLVSGFDPSGDYDLVGENPDLEVTHSKCGVPMIDLEGNGDAYVCINPECDQSVNYKNNKAIRVASVKSILGSMRVTVSSEVSAKLPIKPTGANKRPKLPSKKVANDLE